MTNRKEILDRIERATRALIVAEREYLVVKDTYDRKVEALRVTKDVRADATTELFESIRDEVAGRGGA
jgi:hypothetical protein